MLEREAWLRAAFNVFDLCQNKDEFTLLILERWLSFKQKRLPDYTWKRVDLPIFQS